jgi:glutathione S-transferase
MTEYSAVPELDEFPNVQKWMHRLLQRPGFERGRNVPGPHYHLELNKLSEEELNELSRARGAWVQVGMKRDAEA